MSFKDFLIEKINNMENEADIVMHQIINVIDDAHVEYTDDRLDFNIGVMIKRSTYTRLWMTIIRESDESIRLAKNKSTTKDGYTIVIETDDYPSRKMIDTFLSNKNIYSGVKRQVVIFAENYKEDSNEFETGYESDKAMNTDANFERLYDTVVKQIKKKIEEYKQIAIDLNHQLDSTANEAEKQMYVRSLEKLKDEYFGDTFKKFKKIAAEAIDVDLTRFEKEYKQKFDSRLEDYYEYIVNM